MMVLYRADAESKRGDISDGSSHGLVVSLVPVTLDSDRAEINDPSLVKRFIHSNNISDISEQKKVLFANVGADIEFAVVSVDAATTSMHAAAVALKALYERGGRISTVKIGGIPCAVINKASEHSDNAYLYIKYILSVYKHATSQSDIVQAGMTIPFRMGDMFIIAKVYDTVPCDQCGTYVRKDAIELHKRRLSCLIRKNTRGIKTARYPMPKSSARGVDNAKSVATEQEVEAKYISWLTKIGTYELSNASIISENNDYSKVVSHILPYVYEHVSVVPSSFTYVIDETLKRTIDLYYDSGMQNNMSLLEFIMLTMSKNANDSQQP
jgi:hypothetical protein